MDKNLAFCWPVFPFMFVLLFQQSEYPEPMLQVGREPPLQAHSVPCITLTNVISSTPTLRSLALALEKQIIPSTNIIQTDLCYFQLS